MKVFVKLQVSLLNSVFFMKHKKHVCNAKRERSWMQKKQNVYQIFT